MCVSIHICDRAVLPNITSAPSFIMFMLHEWINYKSLQIPLQINDNIGLLSSAMLQMCVLGQCLNLCTFLGNQWKCFWADCSISAMWMGWKTSVHGKSSSFCRRHSSCHVLGELPGPDRLCSFTQDIQQLPWPSSNVDLLVNNQLLCRIIQGFANLEHVLCNVPGIKCYDTKGRIFDVSVGTHGMYCLPKLEFLAREH